MIITIGSTKGGVGKSTIACNLAVENALDSKKVMLIDADMQGSSMAFRAIRDKDDIPAMAVTTPTLHKDLSGIKDSFDLILIDAGGRDNAVFRSSIMACDILIIPILPSQYDIWATADTIDILKEASTYKEIKAYFLFNQVIERTTVAKEAQEVLKELSEENNIQLLTTLLHSRVAFKNSISRGLGVSEYEPSGKASYEMQSLHREIMKLANRGVI